jgi:hypothetical protein
VNQRAERQARALRAAAADRATTARTTAEDAIAQLASAGETVTFAAVARTAHVSRKYLYTTPDLAERITRLRDTAPVHGTVALLRRRLQSEQSNAQNLQHRVHELEAQLREARIKSGQGHSADTAG